MAQLKLRVFRTLYLSLVLATPAGAGLPPALDKEPLPSLAPMLEQVTPAVVNIATLTQIEVETHPLLSDPFFRRFFDLPRQRRERKSQSLGSGVILDAEKGLVLTNHHVVDQADEIDVRLRDGRQFSAELVGSDPETDIALLRIPAQDLTPELAKALGAGIGEGVVVSNVEPGSAAEAAGLRPGDVIVAANGRPASGASALRAQIGLMRVGTPLDLEVIRKGKRMLLKSLVADPYAAYVDGGRLSPRIAGARLGDLIESNHNGRLLAVAVGTVDKDSPAWLTGLREGDVLLEVNRERIRHLHELGFVLAQSRALSSLRIRRGDKIIVLSRR